MIEHMQYQAELLPGKEKVADTGLVIGKFYPPHKGHKFLIDTARAQANHVSVIVCDREEYSIPGALRADWISQIHPDVDVLLRDDKLPGDDSARWAEQTLSWLGHTPQLVFSSEDYGIPFSAYLGSNHVSVDRARKRLPIAGTAVREHPLDNLDFLEPCVRAYFVKRVCVLGAESTGTTTMARSLAHHYDTLWVPEYGRSYAEQKLAHAKDQDWQSWEFEHIAREQTHVEEKMAGVANKVLIEDTNAFATSLWHERYMGKSSNTVDELADNAKADLYLLTSPDIPFVQDGTRDGEHLRRWMHQRFIDELKNRNLPYVVLYGSHKERMMEAIHAVGYLIRNE